MNFKESIDLLLSLDELRFRSDEFHLACESMQHASQVAEKSKNVVRLRELLVVVQQNCSENSSCLEMLLILILDKLKSGSKAMKKRVLLLTKWLILGNSANIFEFFGTMLSDAKEDHSTKFNILYLIKHGLSDSKAGDKQATDGNQLGLEILLEPLYSVMESCSIRNKTGKQVQPTRLTIAASDCFAIASCLLCDQVRLNPNAAVEYQQYLFDHDTIFVSYISLLIEWFDENLPLYATSLKYVIKSIELYQSNKTSTNYSIALAFHFHSIANFFTFTQNDTSNDDALLNNITECINELDSINSNVKERLLLINLYSIQLQKLCLILGRSVVVSSEVVSQTGSALIRGLINVLNCKLNDLNLQKICIHLFRYVINLLVKDSPSESYYPMLLSFLDESDAVSDALVGLISEWTIENPSCLLPELQLRINDSTKVKRVNALQVLDDVISKSKDDDLNQRIAVILLDSCMYDSELDIRKQSSKLFVKLQPNFIIPNLLAFLNLENPNIRSIGCDAIVHLLSNHHDICQCISVCIHHLRHGLENQKGSDEFVERFIHLIPKWADLIPEHVWEELIRILLIKVWSCNDDPIIIRFMRQLSKQLSIHSILVFPILVSKMESQAELNESILVDESETASLRIKSLLFSRLSPLLILKIITPESFQQLFEKHNQLYNSIKIALYRRVFHVYEFPEVRKLSSEIVAKLPAILDDKIIDVLECMIGNFLLEQKEYSQQRFDFESLDATWDWNEMIYPCDITICKLAVYSMCQMLVYRGFFKMSVVELLFQCLMLDATDDEIVKLQQGCIECFSLFIKYNLLQYHEYMLKFYHVMDTSPLITEIDCNTPLIQNESDNKSPDSVSVLQSIMEIVLEGKHHDELVQLSARLCAVNIIIHSIRSLATQAGLVANSGFEKKDVLWFSSIQGIARLVITNIVEYLTVNTLSSQELVSPVLQIIFHCLYFGHLAYNQKQEKVFFLKPSEVNNLYSISYQFLQGNDDAAILSGLKVFGLLLTLPKPLLSSLPDASLSVLKRQLGSISMIHASKEARILAESIIKLAFVN